MKENLVKRKLRNGEPVFGVIAPNSDPVIAEVIGHLGFDFYMMDGEHGAIGAGQAQEIVRACEATGITPLARVRSSDMKLILQFLDAGVMGVMMPGLMNARDVRAFVEAVKYPPLGRRGLGPIRAADYMMGPMPQEEYITFSNDQTLVLPQFEDVQALESLGEMVQVEGVDAFVVGPRDLAMSMGFYDGPGHPEVREVIDQVFDIVLGAGLDLGTVAGTGDAAKALVERGARMCINSVANLIKSSAKPFLEQARS
ncbi:MAG: HpcH/HpaI aldolase family protein [bacterium]